MERQIGISLAVLVLAAACHRGSSTMQREQKSYEVVSEGQANGVTSTINAPGETPPPLTNTSADTTSNFTLAPNVDTTGTVPPGTIAGTMPATGPTTAPMPRTAQPTRIITTSTQPQQPSRIVITNTKPPERTDTTATTASQPPPPPSQTDTTSTEEKHSESDDPQNPPPPPPPTQTDTRGW